MENDKPRSKKQQAAWLLDLVRPDGRPEVYDVPPKADSQGYKCFLCEEEGHLFRQHNPPNIYMTSPVNTPGNRPAYICKGHLPENSVIFSPETGKCRDKAGDNEWEEK